MNHPIEKLQKAMRHAMEIRPKVGGFPYLAEALRMAGVLKNIWTLPSCQSIYLMKEGNVVSQSSSIVAGFAEIPRFDKEALIRALRDDQEGRSIFPEFLNRAWQAGVIRYEVDFEKRNVAYYGANGEIYVEDYPPVEVRSIF
ncbi:MAG TPA: DUF1398 family protein [Bdellovibrio sp.]|nr:DUF1398 family protein [Bdellovibrio sp.]